MSGSAHVRVGIIGAGTHTRGTLIPGLRAIDGVEIVAVCNRSRESSQRVADSFGIPKLHDDWRELVAARDVDAIVIGTWPYMHREMVCAALDAGKHVLCEARMAMDAAEARMMLKKSRQHPKLVAQLVPSPFILRVERTVRDLIASGYLGELHAVTVRGVLPAFTDSDAPLHWRQRADLSGVNFLTTGIWYEDMLRWVGPASRVFARTRISTPRRKDAETGAMRAVDLPDHVDIVADLEGGAQASMQFSAVCGLAVGPQIWLFGSDGTLHFDFFSDRLYGGQRGDKALAEIAIAPDKAGRWRVEAEFVAAIRGEGAVERTTFADGLRYMEFTEAVHRSAASGQMVSVPRSG